MATVSQKIKRNGATVTIRTERLLLRSAQDDDADALFEVFHDPKVMRYWSETPHVSIDRTREWIGNMISSEQNGTTDFIIASKDDGKAIGKMGIWQDCEIGFMLNPKYWGQGLMQEALSALLPYFFSEKEFDFITADTDPENQASIALLKKMGFEVFGFKEKTLQVGGRWVDSCYLRLTKEQWEEEKQQA